MDEKSYPILDEEKCMGGTEILRTSAISSTVSPSS